MPYCELLACTDISTGCAFTQFQVPNPGPQQTLPSKYRGQRWIGKHNRRTKLGEERENEWGGGIQNINDETDNTSPVTSRSGVVPPRSIVAAQGHVSAHLHNLQALCFRADFVHRRKQGLHHDKKFPAFYVGQWLTRARHWTLC